MGLLTHREKLTQLRHRLSEAQTQQEREEIQTSGKGRG